MPDEKTPVTADDTLAPETPPLRLDDENLPQPPQVKKPFPKGLLVVIVVVVVLAVAAAVGWFLFIRKPAPASTPAPTTDSSTTTSTDDVPQATNTESFTSNPYRITFQYPKTWTVTEDNDNSILIQSQSFTYKTADGQSKNGNFRVYVRKGATTADSEIIGKGVAIEPSQKLTYTKPTPAQRTETNLSLFGLNNTSNFAFLLITGNFNLKKGDTLGPNFGKEIETVIIGGGYSEPSMQPGMATNPVPVNGFQNTNAYKQAIAIIQSFEIL